MSTAENPCTDLRDRVMQAVVDAYENDQPVRVAQTGTTLDEAVEVGCLTADERDLVEESLEMFRQDVTNRSLAEQLLSGIEETFGTQAVSEAREQAATRAAPEALTAVIQAAGTPGDTDFAFPDASVPAPIQARAVAAVRESLGDLGEYVPDGATVAEVRYIPGGESETGLGERVGAVQPAIEGVTITYDPQVTPPQQIDKFEFRGNSTPSSAPFEIPRGVRIGRSAFSATGEIRTAAEGVRVLERFSYCGPPAVDFERVFVETPERRRIPDDVIEEQSRVQHTTFEQPEPGIIANGPFLWDPAGQLVGIRSEIDQDECLYVDIVQGDEAGAAEWRVWLDVRPEAGASLNPTAPVDVTALTGTPETRLGAWTTAFLLMDGRSPRGLFVELIDEIERNPNVVLVGDRETDLDEAFEAFRAAVLGDTTPQEPAAEPTPGPEPESAPPAETGVPSDASDRSESPPSESRPTGQPAAAAATSEPAHASTEPEQPSEPDEEDDPTFDFPTESGQAGLTDFEVEYESESEAEDEEDEDDDFVVRRGQRNLGEFSNPGGENVRAEIRDRFGTEHPPHAADVELSADVCAAAEAGDSDDLFAWVAHRADQFLDDPALARDVIEAVDPSAEIPEIGRDMAYEIAFTEATVRCGSVGEEFTFEDVQAGGAVDPDVQRFVNIERSREETVEALGLTEGALPVREEDE